MAATVEDERWDDWAAARRRKLTLGLRVSAERRLAWLEEALALAARTGALDRRRALRAGGTCDAFGRDEPAYTTTLSAKGPP